MEETSLARPLAFPCAAFPAGPRRALGSRVSPRVTLLTGSRLPRGSAAVRAVSPFPQIPSCRAAERVRFGTSGLNGSPSLTCETLVIAARLPGSRMHGSGVALTCGSVYGLWAFPNCWIPVFGKSCLPRSRAAMGAGARRAAGSCPLTFPHQRQRRSPRSPALPLLMSWGGWKTAPRGLCNLRGALPEAELRVSVITGRCRSVRLRTSSRK